jgi:hypothetical protein
LSCCSQSIAVPPLSCSCCRRGPPTARPRYGAKPRRSVVATLHLR